MNVKITVTIKPVATEIKKPVAKLHKAVEARPTTLNHKIGRHLIMVSLGLTILVITTFLGDGWALHFGPAFAGVPNLAYEILDWIKRA